MQTADHRSGPPEVAAVTGHSFEVNAYQVCAGCHGSASNAQNLKEVVQELVAEEIQTIKAGLDLWAAAKAPPALAQYGTLAWEYTNPGDLAPAGSVGPTSTEQALIPVNIQKARFNLYLVLYDGSYGVHNAPYASTLLDAAYNWVQTELQ
jgi:hypothetical protein